MHEKNCQAYLGFSEAICEAIKGCRKNSKLMWQWQ